MTSRDQQPGRGRAGHEQACHTSESHPWLAWLTFRWGLVNLRGGMWNPGQGGGGARRQKVPGM